MPDTPTVATGKPATVLSGSRRWVALGILAVSLGIVVLDGTIVGVSLPVIIRDLDMSLTNAEWVNSLYSVVFAALRSMTAANSIRIFNHWCAPPKLKVALDQRRPASVAS